MLIILSGIAIIGLILFGMVAVSYHEHVYKGSDWGD